jgi:hypothetical protein
LNSSNVTDGYEDVLFYEILSDKCKLSKYYLIAQQIYFIKSTELNKIKQEGIMQILFFINSSNILRIKSFYEGVGIIWQEKTDYYFYGINNFFLVLSSRNSQDSRNLYFINEHNIIKFYPNIFSISKDEKIHKIATELFSEDIKCKDKSIIPIMRCLDIEYSLFIHSALGEWKQEKHGAGRVHYCLSNNDVVVEIYPVRKDTGVENIELFISGFADAKSDIKGMIRDPDEHIVFIT